MAIIIVQVIRNGIGDPMPENIASFVEGVLRAAFGKKVRRAVVSVLCGIVGSGSVFGILPTKNPSSEGSVHLEAEVLTQTQCRRIVPFSIRTGSDEAAQIIEQWVREERQEKEKKPRTYRKRVRPPVFSPLDLED